MARLRRRMRFEHLENRSLLAATIGIADVIMDAGSSDGQVVASLEIDNAAGLRGAAVEIHYDQNLLQPDLASVRAGSIWEGKGVAIANVNDQDGTITAFIFATEDMSLSSGSLLDIDFSFNDATADNVRANIGVGSLRLNEGEMPVSPLPISGQAAINGSITRKGTPHSPPPSLGSIGAATRPSVVRPPVAPPISVAKTVAAARTTESHPGELASRPPIPLPRTLPPARVLPAAQAETPRQTTLPQTDAAPTAVRVQPQPSIQRPFASAEQRIVAPRAEAQQQQSIAGNPDAGSVVHVISHATSATHDDALQLDEVMFIGPLFMNGTLSGDPGLLPAAADGNVLGGQGDESVSLETSLGSRDAGVALKGKSGGQIADFTGRALAARKDGFGSVTAPAPRRGPVVLPYINLLGSRRESALPADSAGDDEGEDQADV